MVVEVSCVITATGPVPLTVGRLRPQILGLLQLIKAFEALTLTWPEVREAHMLAGETDFLLKIVATDWDSYQRFLTTRLTAAPNVAHVRSALAIRTSKYEPGVPIDVDAKE